MISRARDLLRLVLSREGMVVSSPGRLHLLHISPGAEMGKCLALQQRIKRTQPAGTGTRGDIPESPTCVSSVVALRNVHVLKPRLIFLFKHWFNIVGSGRDTVLQQVLL